MFSCMKISSFTRKTQTAFLYEWSLSLKFIIFRRSLVAYFASFKNISSASVKKTIACAVDQMFYLAT